MKKILITLLCAFSGVIFTYNASHAQTTVAPQPCDPQFYKQMQSRAWLEAEREIIQNQNLIFKADSVLEYTCFDRFANVAAWEGGNIFTHTDYFGGQIIDRGTNNALEVALQNVVGNSLDAYRGTAADIPLPVISANPDGNFAHSLLGGRGEFLGLSRLPGTEFSPITTQRSYECGVMSQVWQASKCLNLLHNSKFEETDGFYPFDTIKCIDNKEGCEEVEGYATRADPRQYPTACLEGPLATWEAKLIDANNVEEKLYDFQSPLAEVFKEVFEKTEPGRCGQDPIFTGVVVITTSDPIGFPDGVCSNPGCTYTFQGTRSVCQ